MNRIDALLADYASDHRTRGNLVCHTIGITLAGVAAGLGVATLGSRFLRTLLYGISPTDARIFAGVGVVLLAGAALASAWPAWRACRIDPAITLKSD